MRVLIKEAAILHERPGNASHHSSQSQMEWLVAMRRLVFKRINMKTKNQSGSRKKKKKVKRLCPFAQSLLQKSHANNSLLTLHTHTHTASLSSTNDGRLSDPLPSCTPIKMIDNGSVTSSCHIH